ncbi:MAG: cyclic nucleotide-binding domain-containing protein [Frankiales bacterium]|nr:cyclic nucleotide-binding domain-containing protein [Frankiales bacterium]
MAEAELVAALSGIDLFAGVPPKVISRIAETGEREAYAAGSHVISQGDEVAGFRAFSLPVVGMHVILEGTATVLVHGEPAATLRPGQYFGELSLIDGLPRSADVVADAGGLLTFAISKWTFESLLEDHPEVAVPMLRVLCARLRAHEAVDPGGPAAPAPR